MVENKKKLSESIEDYIEKLYIDDPSENGGVRITDLAEAMNVSKASANDAVRRLKDLGYVKHERYRQIYLTEKGKKKGAQIYDRHTTLTSFLTVFIGVDPETAEEDACAIEHIISEETFKKIKKLLNNEIEQI